MTPEELNRTIEFITVSQARLAAAQEQDRRDRIEFQEWSKGLSAQMATLIVHQSERMDRMDQFYGDWVRESREFRTQTRSFNARRCAS
jgi:hypothetical protein